MEAPEAVSGKSLAKVLGIDERTVRKLFTKGVIIRTARGQYSLCQSVQGYIEHVKRPPPIALFDLLKNELRDQ